eukprot:6213357-Pleurochrysis_carterae.AAC.2
MVGDRKVLSQVTWRGLLFEGMGKLAQEIIIEGGHDDARVIGEVLAWRTGVRGGAPAVRFKLARIGSAADHANGEIGESGEDVKPAPGMHTSSFFLQGREAVWEGDEVGKEHNLERQVHPKAHSMRKVA